MGSEGVLDFSNSGPQREKGLGDRGRGFQFPRKFSRRVGGRARNGWVKKKLGSHGDLRGALGRAPNWLFWGYGRGMLSHRRE